MSRHLRILHLNVGKRKQVQQSLLNDETLKDFDALAIVEPYIYRHLHTGKLTVILHTSWQMFTPSVERTDSMPRYTFRLLIWVNSHYKAQAVPVDCYNITAVSIRIEGGSILLISVYDPRAAREESQRETQLAYKLGLVEDIIKKVREEAK
jgi:hypothetical protein